MMGWFPILIDIIVGWWIVLLCGGVGGIILLAIMKNNKMERKNPIDYLDREETSLSFLEYQGIYVDSLSRTGILYNCIIF